MAVDSIMNYIIVGTVSLLVLFSLAPTVFDQYQVLDNQTVSGGTDTYLEAAPVGVAEAIAAVLTIFFIMVLYKMYKES